jgi:hypothetical protein
VYQYVVHDLVSIKTNYKCPAFPTSV